MPALPLTHSPDGDSQWCRITRRVPTPATPGRRRPDGRMLWSCRSRRHKAAGSSGLLNFPFRPVESRRLIMWSESARRGDQDKEDGHVNCHCGVATTSCRELNKQVVLCSVLDTRSDEQTVERDQQERYCPGCYTGAQLPPPSS